MGPHQCWLSTCLLILKGACIPNLVRIVIQLPVHRKTQLDNLKQQDTLPVASSRYVGTGICQNGEEACDATLVVKRANSR